MILSLFTFALGLYLGWKARSFVSARARGKAAARRPTALKSANNKRRVKYSPVLNSLQQEVLSALMAQGASYSQSEAAVLSLSDRKHDTFDELFRAAVAVLQPLKVRRVA